MPAYAFEGLVPVVDPSSYVHPLASLIGDVIVGPGCYLGPGASLRGDFGRIVVEGDTSIQDSCTVHASADRDTVIGRGATIGHGAIVHGCVIGRNTLLGMNAVVLDNAVIGDECLVGALSLVKSDMQVPDRSLVAGNPARVIRAFAPHEVTWKNDGAGEYQRLARESLAGLVECTALSAVEDDRPRVTSKAVGVRLVGPVAARRQREAAEQEQRLRAEGAQS